VHSALTFGASVVMVSEQAQFASLRDWLTEVETFWADQLHAFKKHAEALRQSPRKLKPGLILKAKQRVPKK